MTTTRSNDGTLIEYDRAGSGPPLVLVDGALCTRSIGPGKGLTRRLSEHFTVYSYDRRGRGSSADSEEYAVEREVEDLQADISTAGPGVMLFGQSSGAVLALHAAAGQPLVQRLAIYKAPFVVDGTRQHTGPDYFERLTSHLAAGERGAAVKLFRERVGLPAPLIALMRLSPLWPQLKALAPTLPYDALVTVEHQQGRPITRSDWAAVEQPTLVLAGGNSEPWMRNGMKALAEALPRATHRVLDHQTHQLRPAVVVPELVRFFGDA